MKKHLVTALLIILVLFAYGQKHAPTLTGSVNISVTKGTIECDFILKDMPSINNDYLIRINSGMNIHYFNNLEAKSKIYYDIDNTDSLSSGETIAYYFPGNHNKGRFLPTQLELKYVGMYPIADSVKGYSVQDWKGNMAFNNYSLRADGYQSAWYPVLYDKKKQEIYDEVKYNINVTCNDCSTLFVNGSKPVKAHSANFISDVPRSIAMYCGNYNTAEINGTWILNPDMDKAQQKQFLDIINADKRYYEQNLGIKYKDDITFIQTTPTAEPTEHAFMFVTYPTIMNIGVGKYGLNTLFDKNRGDYYKPYLAHELGHYYFGTYLLTNTEFGAIFGESFSEYLSFKVTKTLIADSIYQNVINKKIKALAKFEGTPFSQIKNKGDLKNREFYAYYYAPIIFTAIEKEIGEKKMWSWLRNILNTPTELTDYAFFEKTFDAAVTNKTEAERIKAKYFQSAEALQNAIKTIKGQ